MIVGREAQTSTGYAVSIFPDRQGRQGIVEIDH